MCFQMVIDNYIHNSSLKRFSQDYGLASYTTHVVRGNFTHVIYILYIQFNVDSERQIFDALPGIRTRAFYLMNQHFLLHYGDFRHR